MVDIYSDEWLAKANEAIRKKGCPLCGSSHAAISRAIKARPIGTFSLSGTQMKVSANVGLTLWCPDCGTAGSITLDE